MLRIGVAGLVGAVVLFMWGAVSWMVLPWHRMEKLPREDVAIRTLRGTESGVYFFPWIEHDPGLSDDQRQLLWDEMVAKHEEGPVGMLIYSDEGHKVMSFPVYLKGFLLYLVASLAASGLLAMAAPALGGYIMRALFVVLVGLYVAAGKDLVAWNYMYWPLDFSIQLAADSLVSALLLGLVLAAVVKPPSGRAAAIAAVT